MTMKPYKNPEYVDFFVDQAGNLVTDPVKVHIRDVAFFLSGVFDGAQVQIQVSPDEMETKMEDLVPGNMAWFNRPEGTWTDGTQNFQEIWENGDFPECWIRAVVTNVGAQTLLSLKMRPRIEGQIAF